MKAPLVHGLVELVPESVQANAAVFVKWKGAVQASLMPNMHLGWARDRAN